MTAEFLITSLVVILLPGTGVIYTLALGISGGFRAGHHGQDLEVAQIRPAGAPALDQGDVLAFEDLEGAGQVRRAIGGLEHHALGNEPAILAHAPQAVLLNDPDLLTGLQSRKAS